MLTTLWTLLEKTPCHALTATFLVVHARSTTLLELLLVRQEARLLVMAKLYFVSISDVGYLELDALGSVQSMIVKPEVLVINDLFKLKFNECKWFFRPEPSKFKFGSLKLLLLHVVWPRKPHSYCE